MYTLFFELIQMSVGMRQDMSHVPSEEEWLTLKRESFRQSLAGVTFIGVEKELKLTGQVLPKWAYEWMVVQLSCEDKYEMQCKQLIKVVKLLEKEHLNYCLLKGLGMSLLYPDPGYRQCGDFDLWIDAPRDVIRTFANKYGQCGHELYHHIDAGKIEGVEVELHFTPSWMNDLFVNRRMQRWFDKCKEKSIETISISGVNIHVPSMEFNRVYILNHIYRHLFNEGIGLRQLMDYYFVLRQGINDKERIECIHTLESFKMMNFAKAVMWVMQKVFALDKSLMIVEPDEHRGRFLLSEIMKAGNFGHYDVRNQYRADDPLWRRTWVRLTHDFRFISQYPDETLWSPIWKVWQKFNQY